MPEPGRTPQNAISLAARSETRVQPQHHTALVRVPPSRVIKCRSSSKSSLLASFEILGADCAMGASALEGMAATAGRMSQVRELHSYTQLLHNKLSMLKVS